MMSFPFIEEDGIEAGLLMLWILDCSVAFCSSIMRFIARMGSNINLSTVFESGKDSGTSSFRREEKEEVCELWTLFKN